MIYPWLVLLHVLFVFGFLLFHGVSMNVFFALKRVRDISQIRTLLMLSGSTFPIMEGCLLLLIVTGVIDGFAGSWWGKGWIWAGLILLVLIYGAMSGLGTQRLNRIRQGVGLPSVYRQPPSATPLSADELDTLLNRLNPVALMIIGFGGIAIITWLMMFKPF